MNRIGTAWTRFEARVVPITAGGVQRRETRRAFFAGAIALWAELFSVTECCSEVTEKEQKAMRELESEFLQYEADLRAGKA